MEAVVIDAVSDLVTGATATPPNLADQLPFARVRRIGGPDDGVTDMATISVEVFASTRQAALELAGLVRQRLTSYPRVTAAGTIDRARTLTAPAEVPWSDTQSLRRFQATYQVMARRRMTT